MRTLVDIPEPDVKALDELGQRSGVSRAKLIRQAIRDFLTSQGPRQFDQAFGLWRERAIDGLEYERRIRREW